MAASRTLPWTWAAALVLSYAWAVAQSAADIPYADDYGALIDFASRVKEHGLSLAQLWAQQNEHRPVFGRLATLMVMLVRGRLDFALITGLGNVAWACCVAMIARVAYKRSAGNAWLTLAIVALLLTPVHHENALWGISGLAFYGLAAFYIACLLLISDGRVLGAIATLVAAVLTSAGGFLLLPVVAGDMLRRREWKRLLAIALSGTLLAVIFFAGHTAAQIPVTQSRTVPSMVRYWFSFLGGAFPSKTAALVAGVVLATALVVTMWRRRQDRFVSSVAGLLMLVAAAAAWSRSPMGIEQALDSRYSVFSLLAICCVLLGLLDEPWARSDVTRFVLACGTLAVAASLTVHVVQADRWTLQRVKMLNEFYLVLGRTPSHGHLTPNLDRARELDVYDGWVAAAAAARISPEPYAEPQTRRVEIRGYVDSFDGRYLLGWAHVPRRDAQRAKIRIVAESESGTWSLPVWRYLRPDLDHVFPDGGRYLKSGFQICLPIFALPPGSYRLRVFVEAGGEWGTLDIEKPFHSPPPPLTLPSPGEKPYEARPAST